MKRGERSTYVILSMIGLSNISLGVVISSLCNYSLFQTFRQSTK